MMDTDDVALWYAFHRLTTSYWYEVNFNGGQEAHEFYLPDALFAVGDNRFEGKSKIHGFYLRRQRHGRITTGHLVSNLKVIRHYGATATNSPNYAATSMTCSEDTCIRRRPTITH